MRAPHTLTPGPPFLRESPSAPTDRSHLTSGHRQHHGCSFKPPEYLSERIVFVVECRLDTTQSARCP